MSTTDEWVSHVHSGGLGHGSPPLTSGSVMSNPGVLVSDVRPGASYPVIEPPQPGGAGRAITTGNWSLSGQPPGDHSLPIKAHNCPVHATISAAGHPPS